MKKRVYVGFGRKDITPDFSVPLAGYGNTLKRMSQGYLTRIYTTCIAITDDNGETVLIYTNDLIRTPGDFTEKIRKMIFEATGVSEQRIMFSATHTHSAPDVGSAVTIDSAFFDLFAKQAVEAAVEAMADRSSAEIKIGRVDVEGLAYVRHYIFDNGNIIGDNFGDPRIGKPVGHTAETDRNMQLIRFEREEGKKDIILANWQAHATVTSTGSYDIGQATFMFVSADYIAPCRSAVEAKTDAHFAFFQGAGGNINPKSMIAEENPTNYYVRYGNILANFVFRALENMNEVSCGEVKTARKVIDVPYDHSDDHRVEDATKIVEVFAETNNRRRCQEMGEPYGIHSAYHAGAIRLRARLGESAALETNAIRVGDISFITAPYEMFCVNGKYIKDNSPYAMTFILSNANQSHSYIPSDAAFEHGCYEVDARYFSKGTAEMLAENYLELLNGLSK